MIEEDLLKPVIYSLIRGTERRLFPTINYNRSCGR